MIEVEKKQTARPTHCAACSREIEIAVQVLHGVDERLTTRTELCRPCASALNNKLDLALREIAV